MMDGLGGGEWERIQAIERAYHARKNPGPTTRIKLEYWRRILQTVRAQGVGVGPDTRVLDMGCGGTSVLLALEQGRLTGVDPLMAFYLARFPALGAAPVDWRTGTVEDFQSATPFDVIFMVNALDHVRSPDRAAANLSGLLAQGGHLVLLLNVHTTRTAQRYFALFHRLIDPPHPHQIHRDDVPTLFADLHLVGVQDIDHLWLDLDARYRAEALRSDPTRRPLIDTALATTLRAPLALSRLLARRPVHRRRPRDRPLMATFLYLFERPGLIDTR